MGQYILYNIGQDFLGRQYLIFTKSSNAYFKLNCWTGSIWYHIVNYFLKWVKTSWTGSIWYHIVTYYVCHDKEEQRWVGKNQWLKNRKWFKTSWTDGIWWNVTQSNCCRRLWGRRIRRVRGRKIRWVQGTITVFLTHPVQFSLILINIF